MRFALIVVLGVLFNSISFAQEVDVDEASLGEQNQVRYNFNFVNMSARSVFLAIGAAAEVDIVPSPLVSKMSGVTLQVTQKTWQEVMEIVCNLYDLHWSIGNKHIYVQTMAEHTKKLDDQASRIKKFENSAPLTQRIIYLNNADLQEMFALVQTLLTGTKGTASTVLRNNAIVVNATEQKHVEIASMIKKLDVETRQVAITARLIVIDSKLLRQLGVDWTAKIGNGSPATGAVGPFDSRAVTDISSTQNGTPLNTNIYTGLFQGDVTIAIANLMSEENVEILASPQITTMDHVEATVFMGEQKNVRTVDAQGIAAFQLQEAGIELTVTPHVTQDNRIRLELQPENNSFSVDAAGQISIQKQEANTQVVVDDGETVVIAGLTSNQETTAESGIPFLKDIPVLGFMFRNERTEIVKKDLIIFVTPNIVNQVDSKSSNE